MTTELISSTPTFEALYRKAYEMASDLLPYMSIGNPEAIFEALRSNEIRWFFWRDCKNQLTLRLTRDDSDKPPIQIVVTSKPHDN